MFEGHREKKAEQAAEAEREAAAAHVAEVRSLIGALDGSQPIVSQGLIVKSGEMVLGEVRGAGLVAERRGPGHYAGASQGISIPVGRVGGRSVRYRVGATRGHYVPGDPVPTCVDHGVVTITSQRLVFRGSVKTTEIPLGHLVGVSHDRGTVTLNVSGRESAIIFSLGAHLDDWFATRMALALTVHDGDVPGALQQLHQQLDEMEGTGSPG